MSSIKDRFNPSKITKNMTSKQIYTIIGIVAGIILAILGIILYNYTTPSIQKVSFFKKVQTADNEHTIPVKKLVNKNGGKEYSFSMWLRINHWINDGTEKNIFSYGHKDTAAHHTNAVPSVWLDSKKNDLNLYVHTTAGSSKSKQAIKVENVPLKQWFKLTIVMTKNSIQVFLNSKLDVFTFLPGDIIIPNGDVYLFSGANKIDGQFSNFIFYKQALTTSEVAKLYAVGAKPTQKSLLFKFVNLFTSVRKYPYDKTLMKQCTDC